MKRASAIGQERIRLAVQGRFNPIAGLTPAKLTQQLNAFRIGDLRALAETWDAMENRDINLKNVAMKRKKAVSRHGWEIMTAENAPEQEAALHKEALEFFYNNLRATSVLDQDERGGLKLLVRQMMDAVGKKFAVHEIVWKPAGPEGMYRREGAKPGLDGYLTAEFRFCPLWFFENRTGKLRFLPRDYATDGEEMRESEWLVTVSDGIMESCAVAYMFKHMSLKDWLIFSEKFGLPGVLGKTDAAPDSPEWEALENAVDTLMNDWAAVASRSSEIELLEAGKTGDQPFKPMVEYMDAKIASIWRGGDLSTQSGTKSDSTGASLQGDEEDILQEDDAEAMSEVLNERVNPLVTQYLFGTKRCLAYLKILTPNKPNVSEDVASATFLINNGGRISLENAHERLNWPMAEEGEELLKAPEPGPKKEFANDGARELIAAALQADFKMFVDRAGRVAAINDSELRQQKARELLADFERIKHGMLADPALARVFHDRVITAFLQGLQETTP